MPGPAPSAPSASSASGPHASAASLPSAAVDAGLGLLCLIRSELRERRPAGLTMAQFRVLHTAYREPERSLADLAEELGLSPPAVTKMADVLAERGLLAREASVGDRRRLSLVLTREGRDIVRQARRALEARVAERLAGLPPAEAAALRAALLVLAGRLAPPAEATA